MDLDGRPSSFLALFAWSWRIGTFRTVEYRVSWTLLLQMLFFAIPFMRDGDWAAVPMALAAPAIAAVIYHCGHLLVRRWARADVSTVLLWAAGDSADWRLPLRWNRQALLASSGILLCVLVAVALQFLLPPIASLQVTYRLLRDPFAAAQATLMEGLGFIALWCVVCAAMNLLPHMLFDGGRLWRALLWPVVGLRRAVWWTMIAGFTCSVAITLLAIWATSPAALLFGVIMLVMSVQEHRSLRTEWDLVLQLEPPRPNARRDGMLAGLHRRWQQRREEADARDVAQEQEVLDQLLAKVSSQGLPSLTERERATLARISKKQQRRQAGG